MPISVAFEKSLLGANLLKACQPGVGVRRFFKESEWAGRSPAVFGNVQHFLCQFEGGGRKVRAPEGVMVGNAHRPKGQGKCHREETAAGFCRR